MIRIVFGLIVAVGVLASNGCYKIDIPQGNIIEQEAVDRLIVGMSKRQVQTVLGTPLLVDPFNQQRWDYIYLFFPRGDESRAQKRHLSLYFSGDSLTRIEGDRSVSKDVPEDVSETPEESSQ